MQFVKLTEPGSSHLIKVVTVTIDASGTWPDYHFSDGRETVVIPQTAADRQLERLKVATPFDLIGAVVKVSRSEKPGKNGKHFWNLDISSPAEQKAAATPPKRIPPPSGAPPQAAVGMGGPPDAPLVGDEPAYTPREVAATEARSQRERDYLACWDRVAAHLAKTCEAHDIPLDASAIQATTFSIFGGAR